MCALASASQVNLGRYQAPLHVAQRTLCQFGIKGYLFGAACLSMGLGLCPAKKAPKAEASSSSAQGGAEDPAAPSESTLKQLAVQPWDSNAQNSLHKAAQVFCSLESYWLQRLVVRSLLPTSEFHSRWPAVAWTRVALKCLLLYYFGPQLHSGFISSRVLCGCSCLGSSTHPCHFVGSTA